MTDMLTRAWRALPHGPEFRFVDRLTALEPGCSGTGEYLVRGDEPFLKGHFPGAPLLPGVLMVEAGAQVAGSVGQTDPRHPEIPNLKLSAVRAARFYGSAVPGDLLRIHARVTGRLGGMIQAETEAFVGQRKVMSASVVLAGDDQPMASEASPK